MISFASLATILLMALVTYSTRVGGYLLLRNRQIDGRSRRVMEAAPGCVLLAIISPYFVASRPADLVALAITIDAASRLPIARSLPSPSLQPGCCGRSWGEMTTQLPNHDA